MIDENLKLQLIRYLLIVYDVVSILGCFNIVIFWGNAGNLTWYRRLADSPRKDPYTNAVLKIGERFVEGFWVSSGFRTFRAAHKPLDTESVPILEMKPTPKSFMPPRITASALV